MKIGDRVIWLGAGRVPKQGRISMLNEHTHTIDITFFDASTRGGLPWAEVLPEDEGAAIFMPAEDIVSSTLKPPGIASQETIGGLGA